MFDRTHVMTKRTWRRKAQDQGLIDVAASLVDLSERCQRQPSKCRQISATLWDSRNALRLLSSCIRCALPVARPASLHAWSFETPELVREEGDRRDETVLRAGLGGGEGGKRTGAVENLERLPIEDLVAR